MHVSQLMQIDMSMSRGGFCHLGFRSRSAIRSARVDAAIAPEGTTGGAVIDPRVKAGARSEEHTSELQSLMRISYDVFCLKKKTKQNRKNCRHLKKTVQN